MADKQITYNVSANTTQAQAAFNNLTQSTQKNASNLRNNSQAALEFGRILQDLPFGIMGMANNVTRLTEVLAAPAGLTIAVSAAMSALLIFQRSLSDAKRESERWDLASLIGDLNAYEKALAGVRKEIQGLSDANLGKTIGELNKKISETTFSFIRAAQASAGTGQGLAGALVYDMFGSPKYFAEELSKLMGALNEADKELQNRIDNPKSYNALKKRLDSLTEDFRAGNTALAPEIKKLESQLRNIDSLLDNDKPEKFAAMTEPMTRSEWINALLKDRGLDPAQVRAELDENTRAIQKEVDRYWDTLNKERETKWQPDALARGSRWMDMYRPEKRTEESLKEENQLLYTTMTSTANSLGNVFKQMWRDIFGEADTLWGVFFQSLWSDIASMGSKGLGTDLLNLVFPGAGLVGGLFTRQTPAQQVTVVNIGDKTVARVVTDGYNTAQRLRYGMVG